MNGREIWVVVTYQQTGAYSLPQAAFSSKEEAEKWIEERMKHRVHVNMKARSVKLIVGEH